MTKGIADQMLSDKIDESIDKMKESLDSPCTPVAHNAVVEGVICLLEIKQWELKNEPHDTNSEVMLLGGKLASFKNIKFTGRDAVLLVILTVMALLTYKVTVGI